MAPGDEPRRVQLVNFDRRWTACIDGDPITGPTSLLVAMAFAENASRMMRCPLDVWLLDDGVVALADDA